MWNTIVLLNMFLETVIIFSELLNSSYEQYSFEIDFFYIKCFEQFNVPPHNKNIYFFYILTANLQMVM